MKLELEQIARARARQTRARHGEAAGMDYLLTRIRRELETRWRLASPVARDGGREVAPPTAPTSTTDPAEVLLLDFTPTDFHLGELVTLQHASLLETQTTPANHTNFYGHSPSRFDGVVMCLQPAWLEMETLFAESLRVLRPQGILLFCTFGPDTLQQLRWAWHQVEPRAHVHPFTDMHHLGDQLLQSGFTRPIVDADWVTVEYADAATLYADLRGEGFTNIQQQRRKTLTGKNRFNAFHRALDGLRTSGAPLGITYELIYGVATAPSSPAPVQVAPPKPQG